MRDLIDAPFAAFQVVLAQLVLDFFDELETFACCSTDLIGCGGSDETRKAGRCRL